ncbi:MAG TPA: hypothetical protein VM818_11320 [Vicinamibacterales bacterium]|nr:hypothetical protein [Vicinamibacterales bacterium]
MRALLTIVVGLFVISLAQVRAGQDAEPCRPAGKVQFVCGQDAPEDLVLIPGSQWLVASVFSPKGGIRLIDTQNRSTTNAYPTADSRERFDAVTYKTCPGPPGAEQKGSFRTHGLALRPAKNSVHTLYVVHHGTRESIEVFELDARAKPPTLTWIGCAVAPDPVGLNEVVALPDGGFVATDFLARGIDAAARGRMLAGEANGALWEWQPGTGWKMIPGSEASGANGLEISPDGQWFYVAAWGSQSFFRLSRGQTPAKRDSVPLGFRADNVRWAPDGSLFVAGQGGTAPEQTSNVVKIDPITLRVTEVIRHPNSPEFGAGTVAVQVGNEIWVGSFRGDRIARFPATP